MAGQKVSWFTIASNDDHPININELNEHTDKHAYIRHDDEHEENPHTHYVGHLPKNSRTTVSYIAKWAGVAENFVEIVRSSVGILGYLDHSNEPDKIQYDASKIVSNFDLVQYADKENEKINRTQGLQRILEQIENDEIVEYNLEHRVTMQEYVRYQREIDRAFKYKNAKGNTEDREMEVWYICGKAGSGKTTLAKIIAKGFGFDVYVSSGGKNPFDDYKGQPCVILDDARPSDWKFNDFLKLTDNNTSSMVGCRYYNKHFYRCQLLVVTNCEPLTNWYKGLQEYDGEAVDQLTRRFSRVIQIKRTDTKNGVIEAFDSVDKVTMVVDCPSIKQQRSKLSLSRIGRVYDQTEPKQKSFETYDGAEELPW